jgi:hypothetical protein
MYLFIPEELGLNEVEKVYRNMGLPGCLMGVTNVPWGLLLVHPNSALAVKVILRLD